MQQNNTNGSDLGKTGRKHSEDFYVNKTLSCGLCNDDVGVL